MKISISTTLDGMVVTDLDTGKVLTWVNTVQIGYDSSIGRTVTYLATYADSTIEVKSVAPEDAATPPPPVTGVNASPTLPAPATATATAAPAAPG